MLIDLSSEVYRRKTKDFVATFQRRNRQAMAQRIHELAPV
jgi:hypothetical protein